MARLTIPTHDTRPIEWLGTTGLVDASELVRGRSMMTGRVWDDALDEGMTLKSHRTGREVLFVCIATERAPDGDVERWHFHSHGLAEGSLSLFVYND